METMLYALTLVLMPAAALAGFMVWRWDSQARRRAELLERMRRDEVCALADAASAAHLAEEEERLALVLRALYEAAHGVEVVRLDLEVQAWPAIVEGLRVVGRAPRRVISFEVALWLRQVARLSVAAAAGGLIVAQWTNGGIEFMSLPSTPLAAPEHTERVWLAPEQELARHLARAQSLPIRALETDTRLVVRLEKATRGLKARAYQPAS
ncbi:MAG: hypothetical protein AAGH15_05145 [Myxococcota bacterium]